MNRKKKVMIISESTLLNSGFSVLSKALLERLYKTNKYELAELASYIGPEDPRISSLPWKVYPTIPAQNDQKGMQAYHSDMYAQFGALAFESTALDFKPDICLDMRDFWMTCAWFNNSPFRKYLKYILMPMVDSMPQQPEWLDGYKNVDVLLAACGFTKRTFNNEAPDMKVYPELINFAVDDEMFIPMDKQAIRQKLDIPLNANILMNTSRNQPRKDHPGMIDAFALYINKCIENGKKDLAENSYLYIQTSYPDVGWAIDKHVQRSGVGHKILFTYICQACHNYFIGPFETEITHCKYCGQLAAHMPNTGYGLTRQQMAEIYNIADLYIQMSCAEGIAMPIFEAKACGVPVICTNYAAMEDSVIEPGGIPIEVGRFYWEPDSQTGQLRALTDIPDAARQIYNYFNLSDIVKKKLSEDARKSVANYSFNRAARIIGDLIDNMEVLDHSETWLSSKANFAPDVQNLPQFPNNVKFIDWCIDNILGRPELKESYWKYDLLKSLNTGVYIARQSKEAFGPDKLIQMFRNMAAKHNFWENHRLQMINSSILKKNEVWELV